MKYYSQKNPDYKNLKVGGGAATIEQVGCTLCCVAMVAQIDPKTLNETLTKGGGYAGTTKNLMAWDKLPGLLKNVDWQGSAAKPTKYPVIVETDFYAAQGVPQHFFLLFEDGKVVDPLDLVPKKKTNKYKDKMKSVRNLFAKGGAVAETYTIKFGANDVTQDAKGWAHSAVDYRGRLITEQGAHNETKKKLEVAQAAQIELGTIKTKLNTANKEIEKLKNNEEKIIEDANKFIEIAKKENIDLQGKLKIVNENYEVAKKIAENWQELVKLVNDQFEADFGTFHKNEPLQIYNLVRHLKLQDKKVFEYNKKTGWQLIGEGLKKLFGTNE